MEGTEQASHGHQGDRALAGLQEAANYREEAEWGLLLGPM